MKLIDKKWGLKENGPLFGFGYSVFEAYFVFGVEIYREFVGICDESAQGAIDRYNLIKGKG